MKIVLSLIVLAFPTLLWGDAGFAISYRSTPVIVEKNWLNDSNWPDEAAFYEGITTNRSLNMVTLNLYFDDTVKAHDKKTTGGHFVEEYYISVYEAPSRKYPAGRTIEKKVDIGDATAEEINTKNAWRDKVPKVYKKKVWKKKNVKGWLP